MATSGPPGCSPTCSRYLRNAPAHRPSTTSLTETPSAFFTIFTSGNDNDVRAKSRCGVSAALNDVRGALKRPGGGSTSGRRFRWRTRRVDSIVRRDVFATRHGERAIDDAAYA